MFLMARSRMNRSKRLIILLATALCGSTVFTTCATRFREAMVDGTKSYLYNTFLPTLAEDLTLSLTSAISNQDDLESE
jgi:hypothetical protein